MIAVLGVLAGVAGANEVVIGSYGRAQVAADVAGGAAQALDVVWYGSRLHKPSYAELDLGWRTEDEESGTTFRALFTPALSGTLFHYDGTFDASLAVRNLFAEARPAGGPVVVWAGSRMLRGDDVYLLDFWPLDGLNTVGGGGGLNDGTNELTGHIGVNRLSGADWQYQTLEEPLAGAVGTETVTVLDRQRIVGSLRAGRVFALSERLSLRPRIYSEVHGIPEGTRYVEDGTVRQALPAERGLLAGAQISAYGWAPDSYVHLFVRHATGIAAIGELAVPQDGLADDLSVNAAAEDRIALAANHEGGPWGFAVGAYARAFEDADGLSSDFDDGWEANLALRPAVYPTRWLSLAVEGSHQLTWRDGIQPRSGEQGTASITKVSVLPSVQLRPGTFGRPQVRLQYTASLLNDAALDWFAETDTRSGASVRHSVGIGAEWWINSQSYR
jgi:hypothetical protein